MIKSIKYVSKAKQWCLTTVNYDKKGGKNQTQEWFNTEQEALKAMGD